LFYPDRLDEVQIVYERLKSIVHVYLGLGILRRKGIKSIRYMYNGPKVREIYATRLFNRHKKEQKLKDCYVGPLKKAEIEHNISVSAALGDQEVLF